MIVESLAITHVLIDNKST